MTAPFPTSVPAQVTNLRAIDGGRASLPAHNLDAELAVLAALLLGEAGEVDVADLRTYLRPEHFYAPQHRHIYEAILVLIDAGTTIDLVTVTHQLRLVGRLADVGGSPFVTKIVDYVPTLSGIRDYARIVVDAWLVREAESFAARIVAAARQPVADAGHFVDSARKVFEELGQQYGRQDAPTDLTSGFRADFARIEAEAKNPIPPCPTGLEGLDHIMGGGWWRKKMVVVGARPGTGKTALSLLSLVTCASTPVEDGGGAGLMLSVELDDEEIRQRLLSAQSGLTATQVRRCEHIERLTQAAIALAPLPLYIDDKARTPLAIRASVRRHQRLAAARGLPLRLVAIDYLQLVKLDPGVVARTDEERIALVSRELVELRKAFKGTTFMVLAQLNREVASRKDARPRMSDLRGSGQIEQDADTIAMLFHPDEQKRERVTMAFDKNRGLPTGYDLTLHIEQTTGRVAEETL